MTRLPTQTRDSARRHASPPFGERRARSWAKALVPYSADRVRCGLADRRHCVRRAPDRRTIKAVVSGGALGRLHHASSSHGEVVTAPLHGQPRRRAVGHGRLDGGAGGDTASATTREPGRARLVVGASRQPPDACRPRRRCRDCWHSNWEVLGASGRWLEGSAPYRWTASAARSRGPFFLLHRRPDRPGGRAPSRLSY